VIVNWTVSRTEAASGPKNDAILHDVVAAEGLKESFYVEDSQETYLHRLVFNALLGATLDADARASQE
jgi:hypothetical protein